MAAAFSDSLAKAGIDTVMVFTKSCIGCISAVNELVYVYWKKNETLRGLVKFDHSGRHDMNLRGEDLMAYYDKYYAEIANEVLREPGYSLSHYPYTRVHVIVKNDTLINREIPVTYLDSNDDKRLINWVYRVESILFNLERN